MRNIQPRTILIMLCSFYCVLILWANLCMAQSGSLFVANTELTLGLTKPEVEKRIAPHYNLKEVDSGVFLIVSETGPPFDNPGSIIFKGGRVTFISKSWGNYYEPESLRLGQELYSVLSQKPKESSVLKIDTWTTRDVGRVFHRIEVVFKNGKKINIMIHEKVEGLDSDYRWPVLSISESLQAPSPQR